jgi:hypothetical protein
MTWPVATSRPQKEAVEEHLRLLKRKKAYAALLAVRGTLYWDDSDEAWEHGRSEYGTKPLARSFHTPGLLSRLGHLPPAGSGFAPK